MVRLAWEVARMMKTRPRYRQSGPNQHFPSRPRPFTVPERLLRCGSIRDLTMFWVLRQAKGLTQEQRRFVLSAHLHLGLYLYTASTAVSHRHPLRCYCWTVLMSLNVYGMQYRQHRGLQNEQRVRSLEPHRMTEADLRTISRVVGRRLTALRSVEDPNFMQESRSILGRLR